MNRFYDEYHFRPRVVWRIVREALWSAQERKRLTREALEFLRLRSDRRKLRQRPRRRGDSGMTDTGFQSGLQLRTAVLILLIVVFNTAGNVFLSIGMRREVNLRPGRGRISWRRPGSPRRAAAFGSVSPLLALFLVTFLLVLSWADYSYVQPASAAGYALVPLLAHAIAGKTCPRCAGAASP